MSEPITIPANVWDFISKSCADIGRIEHERFSQEIYCQIVESHEITSPIEQLFLIALHVMARANFVEVNPEPREVRGQVLSGAGLHVQSQFQIGRYRVDFLVSRVAHGFSDDQSRVVVELDGHEFHDKNKHQRSYEKARDRHLIRLGFKVLHYTGSDVVADPYRVAHEVMDTLGCFGEIGSDPYNKSNPFGID